MTELGSAIKPRATRFINPVNASDKSVAVYYSLVHRTHINAKCDHDNPENDADADLLTVVGKIITINNDKYNWQLIEEWRGEG